MPTTEGEVVDAKACVTGILSDCAGTIDILIKNCTDYNVYFLKSADACPEAYCFGKICLTAVPVNSFPSVQTFLIVIKVKV